MLLRCYSPVRHFTHPRRNFLVRLACLRHAASVHSEPESNSHVSLKSCYFRPLSHFFNNELIYIFLSKYIKNQKLIRLPSLFKITYRNYLISSFLLSTHNLFVSLSASLKKIPFKNSHKTKKASYFYHIAFLFSSFFKNFFQILNH